MTPYVYVLDNVHLASQAEKKMFDTITTILGIQYHILRKNATQEISLPIIQFHTDY